MQAAVSADEVERAATVDLRMINDFPE